MSRLRFDERRRLEELPRPELEALQFARLNDLLQQILPQNHFYAKRLAGIRLPVIDREQFQSLPFTTKRDLISDRSEDDFATNSTFPREQYVRFHRTSGTRGRPIAVVDTADDWQAWIEQWQFVLDVADVSPQDRVVCASSFGPFAGFWSGFEAVIARGAMGIPAGGMSTRSRLELLRDTGATVVLCTPSYALHMAETARQAELEMAMSNVRCLIVAGEPGGSIAATRRRIETLWNAQVIDHAGATEVGPWGYADRAGRGIFVNEAAFLCEVLDLQSGRPVAEGQTGELVLTTLQRSGCPVIRYRTGDVVRPFWMHSQRNRFVWLDGGVIGRADDMRIVRGVNIFPSALEQILREAADVDEFRIRLVPAGELDRLQIEIEGQGIDPQEIASLFAARLGLQVEVLPVASGSLPRFEGKGQRFFDERSPR